MKKKSLLGLVALMAGIFSVIIVGCNKTTVDSNTTTATDNALAEEEFMRLLPMVNSLCHTYKGRGVERVASSPHYPTVVVGDTTHGWPRTMTINYGTNTVDSSDGRTRSGIIKVTFNNGYWRVWGYGFQATLTFNGYSVTTGGNTTGIVGQVVLMHTLDSTFTESVGSAILTQGSFTMDYSCTRTFYWAQGFKDSVARHSKYYITGSGSGMDHNQVKYTDNITTQLVYDGECTYGNFTSGTMLIVPAGNSNRTVTYNPCSTSANVTIDGNQYSFTLQ